MENRSLSKSKYFAVFATTTLIFTIGILVGNYFSNQKLSNLGELQNDLRIELASIETGYELLKEHPCSNLKNVPQTEQLYDLAKKLSYMEEKLGKKDENVLQLKEYYSLLEIKHWLFLKKYKDMCYVNITDVLYFYSNLGNCPNCEKQGYVLSYIQNKYNDVYIYSFDVNFDNGALNIIKNMYSIGTEMPVLIINEVAYHGFKDSDGIEKIILEKD